MIGFIHATKYFKYINGIHRVLDDATFLVEEQQKVGILSGIGEGKSTVVKVLAGIQQLNQGTFIKTKTAWPLGYSGTFHPYLSARENINIVAQLNYLDPYYLRAFCQDFTEFSGDQLNIKMGAYSGNMRAKLGYALSLSIPCDFLLADEKLYVGDDDFRIKCEVALDLRLKDCGLVFFTRNPKLTQPICQRHGVLRDGKIIMYDTHEGASQNFKKTTTSMIGE